MKRTLPYYVLLFLFACNQQGPESATSASKNDKISDTTVDIVWHGSKIDTAVPGDSISCFFVNEQYCRNALPPVKAAIGFISTFIGSDCQWDGEANDSMTNLNCKLTTALGLGYQCSDTHLNFLHKWFRNDPKLVKRLNSCYNVPFTASSQNALSEMKLELRNDTIIVNFSASGLNMRTEKSWTYTGIYTFKLNEDELHLTSEYESEPEYVSFGEEN